MELQKRFSKFQVGIKPMNALMNALTKLQEPLVSSF